MREKLVKKYSGAAYYSSFTPRIINNVEYFSKIEKADIVLNTKSVFIFSEDANVSQIDLETVLFCIEKHPNRVYKIVGIGRLDHKLRSFPLQWNNISVKTVTIDTIEGEEIERYFTEFCEQKGITFGNEEAPIQNEENTIVKENTKSIPKSQVKQKASKLNQVQQTNRKRGRPKKVTLVEKEEEEEDFVQEEKTDIPEPKSQKKQLEKFENLLEQNIKFQQEMMNKISSSLSEISVSIVKALDQTRKPSETVQHTQVHAPNTAPTPVPFPFAHPNTIGQNQNCCYMYVIPQQSFQPPFKY